MILGEKSNFGKNSNTGVYLKIWGRNERIQERNPHSGARKGSDMQNLPQT